MEENDWKIEEECVRLASMPEALLTWYRASARELPWREDPSPYKVWISEIMLQQTRIEAVKEYFLRFMGIIKGSGDRMVYYTGDLQDDMKSRLSELLKKAAAQLEAWSEEEPFRLLAKEDMIRIMCRAGLVGISEGRLGGNQDR